MPTVATFLSDSLPSFGVSHVFELVGGMVTVLLDAMHQNPALTVVSVHHEQGAGFAAEGFTRMAGVPAVALATSGPGATNLLTAVGSCYFDSIPVVFITGQVNTHEMREEGRGRQGGFQETDIVEMSRPVTKSSRLIRSAGEFPSALSEAFEIAVAGRPGPVLLDIPMDVQRARITPVVERIETRTHPKPQGSARNRAEFLLHLRAALEHSERPLVLAGGGVRGAGAVGAFRELINAWRVPVVTSLMGRDCLPGDSPLNAGMLGSYGNRWSNWAVAQSDLLLVLGSRLDVRQTGSDVAGFRADRPTFHVDVDPTELNNHVRGCVGLAENLASFLPAALSEPVPGNAGWADWPKEIQERRLSWPDTEENVPPQGINPNLAVRQISSAWRDVAAFVTDVGQHQMWAAQSVDLGEHQRFLTSGGMGSMGFGLPASIGAALASGGSPICLVAGDGGFQCNLQELQTAVRIGAQIRVIVLDNGCHGMVRQFQESYFDGRFFSTKWGYSAPDFCKVAAAFGIPAFHVATHDELMTALESAKGILGPSLIHMEINDSLNVYPKMAFGQPFGSMEPHVAPTEMEGT